MTNIDIRSELPIVWCFDLTWQVTWKVSDVKSSQDLNFNLQIWIIQATSGSNLILESFRRRCQNNEQFYMLRITSPRDRGANDKPCWAIYEHNNQFEAPSLISLIHGFRSESDPSCTSRLAHGTLPSVMESSQLLGFCFDCDDHPCRSSHLTVTRWHLSSGDYLLPIMGPWWFLRRTYMYHIWSLSRTYIYILCRDHG